MNTIKINDVNIKIIAEDDEFYYTSNIDKKFTLGMYSSRLAFPKNDNVFYFEQRKLNWWNPFVWLIEIFMFVKTFVMEGVNGVKELVESYSDDFKYGHDDYLHHVFEGYTIER